MIDVVVRRLEIYIQKISFMTTSALAAGLDFQHQAMLSSAVMTALKVITALEVMR